MALIYGIEEAEYEELPAVVKNSIKKSFEDKEALELRLKKLEDGVQAPPNNDPPPVDPKAIIWNPPVSQMEEMNYDNRMDVILMGMKQDNDPTLSTCVRKFEEEIRTNLGKSHPAHRAQHGYVKNIINMVAGQHLAEITQDIRSNGGQFAGLFVEGAGNGGPIREKILTPAESLTPEEKAMADRIGVTYEVFAENK